MNSLFFNNALKLFGCVFLFVASMYIALEVSINFEFYRQMKQQGFNQTTIADEKVDYYEFPLENGDLNNPEEDPNNPFSSLYHT